jgi:hypothetical protein
LLVKVVLVSLGVSLVVKGLEMGRATPGAEST